MRAAPWPDFAGSPIHEGDWIEHPNGDRARVLFSLDTKHDGVSRWRAVYENDDSLWLGNQIGDKGKAIVVKTPNVELSGGPGTPGTSDPAPG